MKKIDILLSTYNGAQYIRELLDSVFCQTNEDWSLIIRDDGSFDTTVDIIREYIQKYPGKVVLITDDLGRLGPKLSFGQLLKLSQAPYLMFCDQDDIWRADKIEISLHKILALEDKFSAQMPLLIFMNSMLVDDRGRILVEDAWKYMGITPEIGQRFRNIILRNIFIGHTMMMNRSLVALALPIPEESIMHDWWVGLTASAFGRTDYISEPRVLYRQHQNNFLGFNKMSLIDFILKHQSPFREYVEFQQRMLNQSRYFCLRFKDLLTNHKGNLNFSDDIEDVCKFVSLKEMPYMQRKLFLLNFYKDFPYRDKALIDILWY
ncbi:MAG: glycosyltransferase family 2 protein [Candidatus Omnitrophica bacterium]|nr:glycosyltransferase family 2 protein [Candidatus Omnitrophota bacterium]